MSFFSMLFGVKENENIVIYDDVKYDLGRYNYASFRKLWDNIRLKIEKFKEDNDCLKFAGMNVKLKDFEIKIPNSNDNLHVYVYQDSGNYINIDEKGDYTIRLKGDRISKSEFYKQMITHIEEMEPFQSEKYKFEKFIKKHMIDLNSSGWYSINNGTHFILIDNEYSLLDRPFKKLIYDFENWKPVELEYSTISKLFDVDTMTVEDCENPRQTYWKHFAEMEIKSKLKRDNEILEFVEDVLLKFIEYKEMYLENKIEHYLPFSEIDYVDDFNNFCEKIGIEYPYMAGEIRLALDKIRRKNYA